MILKNMKIGQKLSLSFGTIIALLLVLAAMAYSRVGQLREDIDVGSKDRYPKTVLAHTIKDELNETAHSMRNLLLMTDAQQIKLEFANLDESSAIITESVDKLDKSVTSVEGRKLLERLQETRAQFLGSKRDFIALVKDGKKDEAVALLLRDVRPNQLAYFKALDELIKLQSFLMQKTGELSTTEANETQMLLLVISLGAVVISFGLGLMTTRSITRPINEAVVIARRVADGDLGGTIVVNSTDETGQLMLALKDMSGSLRSIVGQVRQGTDTIATASSQIAAGNQDLSNRTEEQASSLEETAASMEELTSTVKQNADNAREANRLALIASSTAIKGDMVFAQVVGTMIAINVSSQKIADISGVINRIAFQTNILALNAAVEAARAGEQGLGFSVVAAEVRSLAQRSAEAAKEIKLLIDDTVQKVGQGFIEVSQAGQTMDDILSSVRRVTDIMCEIEAASREQTHGIQQINQAITKIDQVTQQNAALVEESAAAAHSLQEQASELSQVVSVFRLGSAPGHHGATAPRNYSQKLAAPKQPPQARQAIV